MVPTTSKNGRSVKKYTEKMRGKSTQLGRKKALKKRYPSYPNP